MTNLGATLISESEISRYRKLWRYVILQALGEADGEISKFVGTSKNERSRIISRAQKWLVEDSKDLRIVCSLADLEASKLIEYGRGRYVT